MLPTVDLIKADESSWLLMQTPDWVTNSATKNGNKISNHMAITNRHSPLLAVLI